MMVHTPIQRPAPQSVPEITPQPERDATPEAQEARSFRETLWEIVRRYPIPFIVMALLVVSGLLALFAPNNAWRWPLLVIVLLGGVPLLIETVKQLVRREFGVDLLAVLAILGSLLLGEHLAGSVIVLMLSGGGALESFALSRARRSLSSLAERAPRVAHVFRDGSLVTVSADSGEVGTQVVVKPGEVIPVDGLVTEGDSSVSEADLTGEPTPLRKEAGALVLSGSVNLDNPLHVKATRHRLADRYAVWFTAIALLLAGGAWLYTRNPVDALGVLVVATPCPLILATPIAIMSGIDRAARNGLITKSGATIEELGEVDVVVFDKTGTLTLGMPQVVEVAPIAAPPAGADAAPLDQETLISLAASVEQYSPHILARAVVDAAHKSGVALREVSDTREIAGKGILGSVAYRGQGHERATVAI